MIRSLACLLVLAAAPLAARDTGVATPVVIKAQVAAMERDMKPGQGFAWRPLLQGGEAVAAIEIWKRPGRPAVHPDQAEYATVVDGSGTLVMGGTMVAPTTTRADLVEGDKIEGGTTYPLHPGDVIMVPAGVPHWFGITGGRLVLLGTKLTQTAKK
jgi:mannose-6-phosphate isomerase-like protein (cupin superfamily)